MGCPRTTALARSDEHQTLHLVESLETCSAERGGTDALPAERASFTFRREDARGLPVVVLHGELDLATAPQLAAVLDSFGPGETLVVDLCWLGFMDCSGLRELMRGSAVLGDGLHVVCGGHGPVRRLFDLVAVERVLRVHPSRADALRAASGGGGRSAALLGIAAAIPDPRQGRAL